MHPKELLPVPACGQQTTLAQTSKACAGPLRHAGSLPEDTDQRTEVATDKWLLTVCIIALYCEGKSRFEVHYVCRSQGTSRGQRVPCLLFTG